MITISFTEIFSSHLAFSAPEENFWAQRIPNRSYHEFSNISLPHLLFSAHISYGKGEYLNQTVFFLQNLSSTKFIFNFKGVGHKIQLIQI